MNFNIQKAQIITRWMRWEELSQFVTQLISLEVDLIERYHYPGQYSSKDYCTESVRRLEKYLKEGNTYFWAAIKDGELIGYYWAYVINFIDKKRWVIRSLMIKDGFQHSGLGTLAIQSGEKKALSLNCDEMSVEYVPWNKKAALLYEKSGFKVSRIEALKTIK